MLTIYAGSTPRSCDGFARRDLARRDFLRIGALGLGGLSLSSLLALRAGAAQAGADYVRDKAVVLLYLSGGASHIETFDPKITAPLGVRSITGEVSTNVPGVTFGGTFPLLAARADRLAVVRSFQHTVGDHEAAHVHLLTGGTDPTGKGKQGFSMGSAYARLRGTNHPRTGMPTYAVLIENEVDGQYANEQQRAMAGSRPGGLGPSYAPLAHKTQAGEPSVEAVAEVAGGRAKKTAVTKSTRVAPQRNPVADNMQLNLPPERFADRLALLSGLDRLNRLSDVTGTMAGIDKFNAQAVQLVLGGAADAFDFRREPPRLVERYDTRAIQVGFKRFRPSTLGHQMLVARRLCEAGCGFVTVHSAGWDMHADGNNPGIVAGMEMLGRSVDRAVSAFLDDVADRGLSDKILLVITGDFGRTPKVNNRGGRDHWSRLSTLAFAGGGLKMGQVVGRSARGADAPASDPISPAHLMATIMHTLLDPGRLRLSVGAPRELAQLIESGQPIRELV
jgi:hypothetical protein